MREEREWPSTIIAWRREGVPTHEIRPTKPPQNYILEDLSSQLIKLSSLVRIYSSTSKKNPAWWMCVWLGWVDGWCVRGSDGRWQRSMGGCTAATPSLPAQQPRPATAKPNPEKALMRSSSSLIICWLLWMVSASRKIASWVQPRSIECCRGWQGQRRFRWRRQDLTLSSRTWRRSWQRAGLQTSYRLKHFDSNRPFTATGHFCCSPVQCRTVQYFPWQAVTATICCGFHQ